MGEELSYQIINISAVNQAAFCYYEKFSKNQYRKENINVGGSEQRRDALF